MQEKILHRAVVGYLLRPTKYGAEPELVNLPIKKKDIGANFRNGYGGGIELNESPVVAVVREILEEGRIKTWEPDTKRVTLLRCHNRTETGETFLCVVHVFITHFWLNDPKETEEMGTPTWFPTDTLPAPELMPADRIWLPRFFKDRKPLVVTAHYGPHQETLENEIAIEEVAVLPEE